MGYGIVAKLGGTILVVILVFGLGYASAWRSAQVQIGELKGSIQAANAMSAKVLADKTKEVAAATDQAKILNNDLESARESANIAINTYRDQLAVSRLRDPNGNKPRCADSVPSGAASSVSQANAEDGADLSENLARLLRSESARADQCAIDKNLLLDFVNANCGIAK